MKYRVCKNVKKKSENYIHFHLYPYTLIPIIIYINIFYKFYNKCIILKNNHLSM